MKEIIGAHRLCSSQELMKQDVEFALNMFEDNGQSRNMLEGVVNSYTPPEVGSRPKNNSTTNKNMNNKYAGALDPNSVPTNLFDVLPSRDEDISDEEMKPYVVMKYLPDGFYHQIKRACTKAGVNLVTRPGNSLQSLL